MSCNMGGNLTADTVFCLTVFMGLRSVLWVWHKKTPEDALPILYFWHSTMLLDLGYILK